MPVSTMCNVTTAPALQLKCWKFTNEWNGAKLWRKKGIRIKKERKKFNKIWKMAVSCKNADHFNYCHSSRFEVNKFAVGCVRTNFSFNKTAKFAIHWMTKRNETQSHRNTQRNCSFAWLFVLQLDCHNYDRWQRRKKWSKKNTPNCAHHIDIAKPLESIYCEIVFLSRSSFVLIINFRISPSERPLCHQ